MEVKQALYYLSYSFIFKSIIMTRSSENKKQMNQMSGNNAGNKTSKSPDTSRSSNQGRKLASGGNKENNGTGRSKNK
jgi:hypothetical protein